ncbi:MAG: hypothetical protein ACTS22_09595 [Phycisphaerales bacterium]
MTDAFARGGGAADGALSFGPYELVRQLRAGRTAERYLALHPDRLTHHVAYRFGLGSDRSDRRRFLETIERVAAVNSSHTLPVEQFSLASPTEAWVISPFTGDHDGLLLLSDLLADKGGMLEVGEATRAMRQLLAASDAGAAVGLVHGPVSMTEVLVDRRGSLQVELFGVSASLEGIRSEEELRREEVRSILALGYELFTGVSPDSVDLDASRLAPGVSEELDAFFATGLDPVDGFATAEEAIEALRAGTKRVPEVRVTTPAVRKGLGLTRRRSRT